MGTKCVHIQVPIYVCVQGTLGICVSASSTYTGHLCVPLDILCVTNTSACVCMRVRFFKECCVCRQT
jgi:hypothetical protein